MSFSVVTIPPFDRQLKRLAKKYPSLKNDMAELGRQLAENPAMGKPIGQDCYKIRLAISSKGKGKSSGARIITHVYVSGNTLYLLTIYDKSEHDNISDKELNDLLLFI
ncbi:MAG: type II toxin-antitoxin system RelE/ParE family toxin [Bacteroidales bacterium]|nr:type II toxin-antitoxin system RelE/ParE family toxin [Bacteroidales bacterium]